MAKAGHRAPQSTLRRRRTLNISSLLKGVPRPSTGISLSGGGPRSALFCSGVLRQLLADRVRLDFISSVSGGGYVAGSYMEWKCRNGGEDNPAWHKTLLREHGSTAFPTCTVGLEREGFWVGLWDLVWSLSMIFLISVVLSVMQFFSFVMPFVHVFSVIHGRLPALAAR